MGYKLYDEDSVQDIADAIRSKNGSSDTYTIGDMADAIEDIPTGSSVTVTPLSVTQNGTYTAQTGEAYSPVTVNVSGGGGGSVESKDVNFIDYDGMILYSYTKSEFANLTELPANPSHTGLTSQGWNWSLANAKTYVASHGGLVIGQMYITDDEKTRIYVHFEDERKTPFIQLRPNGTVVIDWGDNTATTTLSGTSVSTTKTAFHNYESGGDYVITLTVTGTVSIAGSTASGNGSYLLQKEDGTSSTYASAVYRNSIQKVELGRGIAFGAATFKDMFSLSTITIPKYLTDPWEYVFYDCYSLKSIIIPNENSAVNSYAFYNCSSLESVSVPNNMSGIRSYAFYGCRTLSNFNIPNGATSVDNYAFYNNYSLKSIAIPSGITSIGQNVFSNCYALASIVIPNTVTSIGSSAFSSCYGIKEYHFKSTTPPTLGGSGVFTNIQSDCIIYVPYSADHSVLNAYKTETNWSSHASKMQEEPQ